MEAGFRLDDRYRLDRRLGAAHVWQGWDELLDRWVVVRFVGDPRPSPWQRRRIQERARAVARLAHPAVAHVYDYGEVLENGGVRPYVVTEWVDGESLEERLGRGALGQAEAVAVCGQVAEAMAAAHAEGIAHGRLAAGDVRLTVEGVRLLGFEEDAGEASADEDVAALRTILGRCSGGGAEEVLDDLRERCRSGATSAAEVAGALTPAPEPAGAPVRRRRSRLVTVALAGMLVAVSAVPLVAVMDALRASSPSAEVIVPPPAVSRPAEPDPAPSPQVSEPPDRVTVRALERTLRSIDTGLSLGEIRPEVGSLLATRTSVLLDRLANGRPADVGPQVAALRTIIAQRTPRDIAPDRAASLSEPLVEISTAGPVSAPDNA